MVGGESATFEEARIIFSTLGKSVTHLGDSGSGQAAKLCNQVIAAMNLQAICEAFSLGRSLGLDLRLLRDDGSAGSTGSWMIDNLGPLIIRGDESADSASLCSSRICVRTESALEFGVPMPGAAIASAMFTEARAHGEDSNGNQGLFRVYERLSNQSLRTNI